MEAYSRDALSAPLRALQAVILQVSSGTFNPDATRSGHVVADGSETGSSSGSEASEVISEADGLDPLDEDSPEQFLVNSRSGVVHRSTNGQAACGKPCPKHGVMCKVLPEGAVRCMRCFEQGRQGAALARPAPL